MQLLLLVFVLLGHGLVDLHLSLHGGSLVLQLLLSLHLEGQLHRSEARNLLVAMTLYP